MLKVRDLMSASPATVSPDNTLHEALEQMNRDGCRHLPVVEGGELVGIITDRDLRLDINSPLLEEPGDVSREVVLDSLTVRQCMTADPQCVAPEASAYEVADLLSLSKFGAMPVLEAGELVGIISYVDYLKHFASRA